MQDMSRKQIVIAIGNSDNKLRQSEWAAFSQDLIKLVQDVEFHIRVHFIGATAPFSMYQSAACWVEIPNSECLKVKKCLADMAYRYQQDSIAWLEDGVTQFILPIKPVDEISQDDLPFSDPYDQEKP